MAYIIGQYNHNYDSKDDEDFIIPIDSGIAQRRQADSDKGVTGGTLDPFYDECITLDSSRVFQGGVTYYFRGQIKRMTDSQIFNIKLVNYQRPEKGNGVEQFIKQIVVQGGSYEHEWVSVEIIFTPLEELTFDTLLFELQRNISDYRVMTRYPLIAYQQLGIVKNKIEDMVGNGVQRLLKIGVQSHPGLMMCINREEIHMSRTGIFEIRNGVLPVDFFSVVNAATETGDALDNWKIGKDVEVIDIEYTEVKNPQPGTNPKEEGWYEQSGAGATYTYILTSDTSLESGKTYYIQNNNAEEKERAYAVLSSACFFGEEKEYKIDAFTLDYMYNKNT